MDKDRFDDVVKSLAAGADRRSVLKRIAGGALGGLLGLAGASRAGATHKKGHHCTPSGKHACPEGYTCVDHTCVKTPPPKECADKDQSCQYKPCCDGYYCDEAKKVCKPKPTCAGKDASCKYTPCCDGYYCDSAKKVCKPKA